MSLWSTHLASSHSAVAAVAGGDVNFQLQVLDEVDGCADQRLQAIGRDGRGDGCAVGYSVGA